MCSLSFTCSLSTDLVTLPLYKSNGLSKSIAIPNRLTIVDGRGVVVGRGVLGRRAGGGGRHSGSNHETLMRKLWERERERGEIYKKIIFKYTKKKNQKLSKIQEKFLVFELSIWFPRKPKQNLQSWKKFWKFDFSITRLDAEKLKETKRLVKI